MTTPPTGRRSRPTGSRLAKQNRLQPNQGQCPLR
jgi:hypothetical protein